jgi:hypothetical protein
LISITLNLHLLGEKKTCLSLLGRTEPEKWACAYLLPPIVSLPNNEIASIKPMQYAAKIQAAMARKLKADAGYSRKLTKNPYNPLGGRCTSLISRICSMSLPIMLWLKHLGKASKSKA